MDHRTSRAARAGLRPMLAVAAMLAGVATSSPADADTYPRQPGVDVRHYVFRVTLRDDVDEVEGEATVEVGFDRAGVSELALDLASARGGKGMTVAGVRSGSGPSAFAHADDRLRIAVEPPSTAGERRAYTVRYRGVPAAGLRIGPNKHGERTFFSDHWPDRARGWLPTVDHPSDKATSELVVTAPARYQVVSNGLLVEETDLGDGRRTTHWRESVPIASWLNALGVAQFASRHAGAVGGVPVEVWSFHQDREAGPRSLEGPSRRALAFFADRVGPFPYEKLGGVEAAGIDGGMELAGAIFYGEKAVDGKPATSLVSHEVAHQWFGDSVTERDWDDVWLSEGFATYFALLFDEHDSGRDAFVAGLIKSRSKVLATEAENPGLAVIHPNLADTRKVLNRLVYEKGAWFLHMLRHRIGDDFFHDGIRAYYRRHRDGNVSTADFRRAMEEASGQDLGPFFAQWLVRPGSPRVEGTWGYDAATGRVSVVLEQAQAGAPFVLPIEVGIAETGAAAPRIERVELTGKSHRFEFKAGTEPSSVVLDPETWALIDARFSRR